MKPQVRDGNLARPLLFRLARTKYGHKATVRVFRFKSEFHAGKPSWANYLEGRWYLKRVKGGFGWRVTILGYVCQGLHQWYALQRSPRPPRTCLECPRCGFVNDRRNFFRVEAERLSNG